MAVVTRLIDMDQAAVGKDSDGSVLFDDPAAPWVVRIWLHTPVDGPPVIARMRVDVRIPDVGITAPRLARLPTTQMLYAAAATADEHPNDAIYRLLATQRPAGQRSWDDEHWDQVLQVYRWARDTNRKGGGVKAVADFWGVAMRHTAYRWVSTAKALRGYVDDEGDGVE